MGDLITPQPSLIDHSVKPAGAALSFTRTASKFARHRVSKAGWAAAPWMYPLALAICDAAIWWALYVGASAMLGPANRYGWAEIVVPIAVLIPALSLIGAYSPRAKIASLQYATEHLITCLCALPLAALVLYLVANYNQTINSSRGIFALSALAFTGFSLGFRRSLWFALGRVRKPRALLVVADAAHARRFYRSCLAHDHLQALEFMATDPALVGHHVDGPHSPVFDAPASTLPDRLQAAGDLPHEAVVIAADPASVDGDLMQFLATVHFAELPVYSVETFYETYWEKMPADQLTPRWPLEARCQLVRHSAYSATKRAADIAMSLVVLVLTSPLLLLAALAIRLESRGPVIFRQTRIGRHRQPFTLYKLRTMRIGSERDVVCTTERDPRITRVGRLLRLTRIDELPQLVNVFVGDMSLIGPRAEWDKLVERYEQQIPYYHFRHLVRPGITGWAQVNYRYGVNVEDTVEKLMYDLYYIRNFSLRLDAAVVLKTIHTVLFCKGR
jgi:exopolysaccharide biosynthesis polyprenyl glycosylphosphotransferase